MNFRPAPVRWRTFALFLATSAFAHAAFSVGGAAYTKRIETSLLAEPQPLASVAGKVARGRKLKVKETRGSWLKVSDGRNTGWVFAGNVSENKPDDNAGADNLGLSASTTTATAAARPLTPAASDYADRRNLGDARNDLDWLNTECFQITDADVQQFLKDQKKGEFQ
ncbi:MAG: SH3 domain-containing protein [Opitutaceae bacterium]